MSLQGDFHYAADVSVTSSLTSVSTEIPNSRPTTDDEGKDLLPLLPLWVCLIQITSASNTRTWNIYVEFRSEVLHIMVEGEEFVLNADQRCYEILQREISAFNKDHRCYRILQCETFVLNADHVCYKILERETFVFNSAHMCTTY